MYISEIDNILDMAIDDIFENLKKYKSELEELYKTKNLMKYEKKMNEMILKLFKLIDEEALKAIIRKTANIEMVINVIKKYCAYYIFIHIGLNYKESIQTFNNNITEISTSPTKIKIEDFFITFTNSKIIHSVQLIQNINEYFKNKEKYQYNQLLDEFIKFYGIQNLSNLEKFIKDEPNKNVKMHNLIKLIIFTTLYVSKEKEEIFNILEESENATGDFIFIDIVIPKSDFVDYHAIESILTEKEIKNSYHKIIYDVINVDTVGEMEHVKNYYSNYEYKINKLVENNIIVPIVDDILLYDNINYSYEQNKEKDKKKTDNTRIKFIVSNINKARELYSNPVENKKIFYEPYDYKNVILINSIENFKIKSSIKNFINIPTELVGLYIDFETYINYPFLSYKDIKNNNGFPIVLKQTNDVIRFVCLDKNIKHPTNELYVRSTSKHNIINMVGFAVVNNNIDLHCMNTTQFKNYSNLHNVNEMIEEGLLKKMEFKYLKKNFDNFYVLFNMKTQKYNIGQNNTIDKYNNNVEMLVAYYYDYYVSQLILFIHKEFEKMKNKTIDFYINTLNNFIFKFPDILNKSYIQSYSNLMELIYKKVNLTQDEYDESEDKFNGIFGNIYKLPSFIKKSVQTKPILNISTIPKNIKNKIITNGKLSDNVICQHYISWNNIDYNNSNDIYEFMDMFVSYDNQNNYICSSCGAQIDLKKYVNETVYSNGTQNQHLMDVLVNTNIEDIYEYTKYKTAIMNIDKIIDKISSIVGLKFLGGALYSAISKRKIITKNTVDLSIQQNLYATKIDYYGNRQQILTSYGFNDKTVYSFPIFDFENTIFTKSSKDDDLYKINKYNTILSYIIILILIELDELQFLNFKPDKLVNYKVFDKIFMQVFKNYKIIVNMSHDLEHIYKYPILCFAIFVITGYAVKYNIYGKKEDNITNKHLILIGLVIEYFNLILTAPSDELMKNKIYIYEVITSKYYLKLKTLYNNSKFLEKIKHQYTNTNIEKETENLFETDKYNFDFVEKDFNVSDVFIPKPANSGYLLLEKSSNHKNVYPNNISTCSNCPSGIFHNFDDSFKCSLCDFKIVDCKDDSKSNIDILENYKKEKLFKLTTKYCMNGNIHIFKNDICINCNYDRDKKQTFTMEELEKLKKSIKHIKYQNYIELSKQITFKNENTEKEKKEIVRIIDKINTNFEKKKKDIKKTVIDFMDFIQNIIGLEININKEDYHLQYNIYKIYYDIDGKKLENPYNIIENSKDVSFIKNHDVFNTDVIIFNIFQPEKMELYYSYLTKVLLGYKKHGKNLISVKLNQLCVFHVNYSIKNILLTYGLKSVNLHVKDYYPNLKPNEEVEMKKFINRISNLRFNHLLNLGLELKKYVSRLHNKYFKYLIPPPFLESSVFTRQDYEHNYYNQKNDINYVYSMKKMNNANIENTYKHKKFIKHYSTIRSYYKYVPIDDDFKKSLSLSSNLIIDFDNSSNVILNYFIEEMQYFIENNDKNIKNNLVLFLLELIINLFSSINIDVSSNVSLIIYEQKINLNSELYKEIISSSVINEITDLYGISTEEEMEEYSDELKQIIQNDKEDNEELNDAMEEVEEDDYDETLNDVEFE